MINNKNGNAIVANFISIIITMIIIVAVGIVYYGFLSPEELKIEEANYVRIDLKDYEIDKEFELGLDTVVDISYHNSELDMHRDLKDYYQGREDPFSQSDNRNSIELKEDESPRYTDSRPDLVPSIDDEETEIDLNKGNSTILDF